MRAVKSRNFFEQMKGRGVRVINDTDFQAVTPDATSKTHFVLVDCVGVSEQEMTDSRPLERQHSIAFDKLLQAVGFGSTDPDILSSLAARLARLDRQIGVPERQALAETAGGVTLGEIAGGIVEALDPDRQVEAARAEAGLLRQAAMPLASNAALRNQIAQVKQRFEQTIDTVSKDAVLDAGFSASAREKARELVVSFERFIAENRDEITALQVLYSVPYGRRLCFADIKALAQAIQAPPRSWTPELLWRAYETLDQSKVRGSGGRVLADIVALVRFALHREDELVPFPDQVKERFDRWLAQQESRGRSFTEEQRRWLELIRDHIAASLRIEPADFDEVPFSQRGGLGRVYQVFGEELDRVLDELNEVLVA
jgi:type I restriction enzyme R subunit